jgi:class 3 adenylate cyclase
VERKVATVLFADLVGSTELGEQDPERTRALLDRFYGAMAEEVERAGGTVEKFAGDAVMAAFGAPAALEDHAERALHAALAMQRRVGELDAGLELRIGVNTGDVVVDVPRAGSSFVTGDAVNVCARLEQNAAPGDILVGERTASVARGAFEFDDPMRIEAKGKRDQVACRRLVRALSLMRPRGVGALSGAFVGRERELDLLLTTYRRAAELGEPHLVSVVGDAGVGKTRLLRELWERLSSEPDEPLRRTGRCLAYGQGITYWPVGEMLKEHFGIFENEAPDGVRRRLGARAPLGLAVGLDPGDVHPLAAREAFQDAWIEFATELATERPAVLLVEDVHWAETPLLELLERTIRDVQGSLLLVVTTRPGAEWLGAGRNATTIHLEPLALADASKMLAELPHRAREVVVARAEGNPFFVEELAASLIDRGVVQRRDGVWELAAELDELSMPDSVRGVLAARIDLLDPPRKAALQAAAVIGRVFWQGAVRALLESQSDVDLRELEERDFVRRRAGSSMAGEREYAIKHALTREVAYETLPKAERARLHARFARWLEGLDARDELASLLAHHYAEAVRPEDADLAWAGADEELARLRTRALTWLREAARRAASRYEIGDAVSLLRRALPHSAAGDERATVLRELAHTYALEFAGEEFWTTMQQAIAEAQSLQLEAELFADLAYETAIRSGIWKRMPDRELVDGWVDRALAGARPDSAARAKALIARARWRPRDAGTAAVEASALAEKLGDAELRSSAWDARGIVSFVGGEFDLGRAWAERRFELLDEISDPDIRADIYSAPITGCVWSGRFREARRLARAQDEIASQLTPHHRMHAVAIDAEVEELLACWDVIRGLQTRIEQAVHENRATPCVRNARSLLVCALANQQLGNEETARQLEAAAHEQWMEGYGFTLDTPRLRLALARGELAEVERLLALPDTVHGWHRGWFVFADVTASLDALAALGLRDRVEAEAPRFARRRSYVEPFALRALGRVREDDELVLRALARFEELGLDWHAAETRALF